MDQECIPPAANDETSIVEQRVQLDDIRPHHGSSTWNSIFDTIAEDGQIGAGTGQTLNQHDSSSSIPIEGAIVAVRYMIAFS